MKINNDELPLRMGMRESGVDASHGGRAPIVDISCRLPMVMGLVAVGGRWVGTFRYLSSG